MVDLVTGACGFIGSHLALALAREGRSVRALVRHASLPEALVDAGVESVPGDLTVSTTLRPALDEVERVFHCAAKVGDWGDRREFYAANVDGVAHLLAELPAAGVRRLIHFSTTDVYGYPDQPVEETAPHVARGWPYADTKIAGEALVWRFAEESDVEVTVIRPVNVYGPGSRSFVAEIAGLLRARRMLHLGRGRRPAGLCHVGNLVEATLRAASRDGAIGQAYNVRDDSDLCWRDATNLLADALGLSRPWLNLPRSVAYGAGWLLERIHGIGNRTERPWITRMAVDLFTTDQSFSIAKARSELGYTPRLDFAGSLPSMVRWLEGGSPWPV